MGLFCGNICRVHNEVRQSELGNATETGGRIYFYGNSGKGSLVQSWTLGYKEKKDSIYRNKVVLDCLDPLGSYYFETGLSGLGYN